MNRKQIFETVVEIVSDKLYKEKEECVGTAKLRDDLGADSLDEVELVVDLEIKFDISANDEELEKMVTIDDIVNLICKKLKTK